MKKTFISSLVVLVALFVFASGTAFAQNQQVVLPSAGLTPESPFYFLDKFGETLREFFTFNPEGKARLQIKFAAERVSEVRTMLERDEPNMRAIKVAFVRIEIHSTRAADILKELGAELATDILSQFDSLENILDETIDAAQDKLELVALREAQVLQQKLAEAAFKKAMEETLRRIAEEIDKEVGRPLEGFTIVEDEMNVNVDDDTYSATYRAEANEVLDLAVLRDRILARTGDWESGDVELDDDSLDITFEKKYGPVTIDGIELFPEASVTISVTVNSPKLGMTSINYDVDITLETRSEDLADLLEEEMENVEAALDELYEKAEEQLGAEKAAVRAIKEAEEGKQELMRELANENIVVPAEAFGKFDSLLVQAKSAFAVGNFPEAKRLAKQAEKNLDSVREAIEDLEKAKEKAKELKEKQKEKEREAKEAKEEKVKEEAEKDAERLEKERKKAEEEIRKLEKEREKAEEEIRKTEEQLREAGNERE
ncbi:MAG: hypothetical protein DDT19_02378 [Syntrophomonadaceae bacterium]|nr:hypothetical protein [Bacillota bacterium]